MNSLEHTLIILLLLVGLLNSRVLRGYWWLVLGATLGLALFSPVYPLPLPWNWLAGLAIPLLFWQTAHRLVNVRWTSKPVELLLWIILVLVLTGALWWIGKMALTGAFLFGIMIASMAWRAVEGEDRSTYLGQIGALALAFLLAEVMPAGGTFNRLLYLMAGGVLVGSLTGYFSARIAENVPPGWQRDMLSIAQGYLAYGLALLLNFSPVAATIISVVVYVNVGFRRGLWVTGVVEPRPLANRPIFGALLIALAFFAWQTHVPLETILLVDLILALAIVALFVSLGRSLNLSSFQRERPLVKIFIRVGFLVLPALLLWPREVFLQPEPIAVALLASAATVLVTYVGLSPLLRLYAFLETNQAAAQESDQLYPRLMVDDLLVTDFPVAGPDTRVDQLSDLLLGNENACLPVVDSENRLLGMITHADLFYKEETLPRSSITYTSLFGEAVLENRLIGSYIEGAATRCATDVMTADVLWVETGSQAEEAIQLMIRSHLHCLPVISADPQAGGKLVGLFTRTHLIRSLSDQKRLSELRAHLSGWEQRGD